MSQLLRTFVQQAACILFSFLAFLSSTALGQADARKAFEASGLESLFSLAPQTALEVAEQLGAEETVMAAWKASVLAHLAPDILAEALGVEFTDALTPESVDAIIAFRQSDLGQAITAAEAENNSAHNEAHEESRRLAAEEVGALSEDRRALYVELAELTAPLNGDVHFIALVEALLAPLLPQDELEASLKALTRAVAETPKIDLQLERVALTFRDFSDTNLTAYISHLQSPEGQAFLKAKATSEDFVFRNAVTALAADFAARSPGQ